MAAKRLVFGFVLRQTSTHLRPSLAGLAGKPATGDGVDLILQFIADAPDQKARRRGIRFSSQRSSSTLPTLCGPRNVKEQLSWVGGRQGLAVSDSLHLKSGSESEPGSFCRLRVFQRINPFLASGICRNPAHQPQDQNGPEPTS
jgi:hypothetical protein